ncbi:unnamed protein product [Trichogramma brassicae]|uniref:Uncharacterized protein n=1 Tax=Trichogramma brassicae TaxID=86971 RepID=A0A6H5I7P2_9HYME|nr:unnamed protein product [Trichogramma brassicae]
MKLKNVSTFLNQLMLKQKKTKEQSEEWKKFKLFENECIKASKQGSIGISKKSTRISRSTRPRDQRLEGPTSESARNFYTRKKSIASLRCPPLQSIQTCKLMVQENGSSSSWLAAATKTSPKSMKTASHCYIAPQPSHDATRRLRYDLLVRELFDIYNRFDVNYTRPRRTHPFSCGLCVCGHVAVIEKFLEFGQDPDCLNVSLIVNPPLYT